MPSTHNLSTHNASREATDCVTVLPPLLLPRPWRTRHQLFCHLIGCRNKDYTRTAPAVTEAVTYNLFAARQGRRSRSVWPMSPAAQRQPAASCLPDDISGE
ncbi:hypothetical protein J6590_072208 [Homalodisca vitripennis]|nr:hypothetical protein J6590_072208 [Homalodisca vitripennis]